MASMAATNTKTVCTSALRGNWPFLEASSSLRGVACSVFSPAKSIPSSPGPEELRYAEKVLRQATEIIHHMLGHETQSQPENHQSGQSPEAEALDKHIHLWNRAADYRKNKVHQKRNRDHGCGD